MNIDKLEAGRELDALVWLALNGKAGETTEQGVLGCRYVDGDVQPHAGYPMGHVSPPGYSTDIAAAWDVVEKLSIPDDVFCLEYGMGAWVCYFDDHIWAKAPYAPLAICRAALKAVC